MRYGKEQLSNMANYRGGHVELKGIQTITNNTTGMSTLSLTSRGNHLPIRVFFRQICSQICSQLPCGNQFRVHRGSPWNLDRKEVLKFEGLGTDASGSEWSKGITRIQGWNQSGARAARMVPQWCVWSTSYSQDHDTSTVPTIVNLAINKNLAIDFGAPSWFWSTYWYTSFFCGLSYHDFNSLWILYTGPPHKQ